MGAVGLRWFTELFGTHVGQEELELREKLKGEIALMLEAPLMPGERLTASERRDVRKNIKSKGRWYGGKYRGAFE